MLSIVHIVYFHLYTYIALLYDVHFLTYNDIRDWPTLLDPDTMVLT